MKMPFNIINRGSALRLVFVLLLVLLATVLPIQAQNVTIYSWMLPGAVRSEDIRIRHISTAMSNLFNLGTPESVRLIKSENAIYVRFHNNGGSIIPDGAVTVTAAYAETDPGLAPSALESAVAAVSSWTTIGSYIMDLDILPSDPPGFGLLPGATYPTTREIGMPSRYRIACSVDCDKPMPTSFFLRVTLSYAADTNASDNVAFSYYDLTEGTPPADVVILHDVSGSMRSELPWAKERAKMFIDLMNKGDRVGVVAFSTQFTGNTEIKATLNQISSIDPSDPAKTLAKDGIDSFTANGMTPMGSGIISAQQVLNAALVPSVNRVIVMLTDGKENQDPRLKDPPGYPILTGLNSDTKGAIALYPLWFGTMSHWGKSLLEDIITHVDKGKLVDQPEDDLKLAEAYLMIRGILTSDDIYDIYHGTLGDGFEGSIHVDSVTEELVLTVAWRTFEQDLDVSILPPGDSQWHDAESLDARTFRGQIYVIHRFQNPQPGQWKYRLSRTANVASHRQIEEPYVLAALADKVEVLMQSSLAKNSIRAGEPLIINARLSRKGKPVPGATVRATVAVPTNSLGTILNEHRDSFMTPWSSGYDSDVTRAAGIIKELKKILGSDKILTYKPKTMVLRDEEGDGTYTASFKDTLVAGTYRIVITAENNTSMADNSFQRKHHHAAVVSLGPIDTDRSKVNVSLRDPIGGPDVAIWQVNIVPVDVYGNSSDPGYANQIQVEATAGQWLRELVDNEDGSYSRYLQLETSKPAKIAVMAFGKKLPKRNVGELIQKNWQVSIHAGTVLPTGSLDYVVDRGSSFSLDLGYRVSHYLTSLLLIGAHEFPREVGGIENVLQLSVNLRTRLSDKGLSPYVQGGPGLYRIFNKWEGGLNVGAGFLYPASTRVDLEGGVDFHNIFLDGDDVRFWQVHIGFSFRF